MVGLEVTPSTMEEAAAMAEAAVSTLWLISPKGVFDVVATGGFSGGFRDSSRKQEFEEYDAGEWEGTPRTSNPTSQPAGGSGSTRTTTTTTQLVAKSEPKAPQPPKVQNLLDFDDDSWGPTTSAPTAAPEVAAPTAAAPKLAASNDCESCIELFRSICG